MTATATPTQATTRVKLTTIDLDISIQCRANIDTATVNEYAERMTEGDKFPPIVVFGSKERSWIGDGWHRIMAAHQIALVYIEAEIHPGGRIDALKHALSSNALHGNRRTNPDKRRCVEIALREFPKLTDPAIGKLCGVDHKTVAVYRPPTLGNSQPDKRIGLDGKEYTHHREPAPPREQEHDGGGGGGTQIQDLASRPRPPVHGNAICLDRREEPGGYQTRGCRA